MARRSTIKRLPRELREQISDLRENGATIDEIKAALDDLGARVSRSALGRHVKGLDQLAERVRRSREIAEVLVRRIGDAPENRQTQANIELMHTAIQDLFMSGEDGEGGIQLDPENAMFLSRAIKDLAAAAKADVDNTLRLRKEAEKAAADKAMKAAEKAMGTDDGKPVNRAAILKQIREEVYGIIDT